MRAFFRLLSRAGHLLQNAQKRGRGLALRLDVRVGPELRCALLIFYCIHPWIHHTGKAAKRAAGP